MSLPGKHMEQLRLAPSQMLPRGQLKKPLRDILRDISKRSKANVDMRGGPGGSIIFEGKGSVDAVRQALKEVAQQVGSKACISVVEVWGELSTNVSPIAIGSRSDSYIRSASHHRTPGCRRSRHSAADRRSCAGTSRRGICSWSGR